MLTSPQNGESRGHALLSRVEAEVALECLCGSMVRFEFDDITLAKYVVTGILAIKIPTDVLPLLLHPGVFGAILCHLTVC